MVEQHKADAAESIAASLYVRSNGIGSSIDRGAGRTMLFIVPQIRSVAGFAAVAIYAYVIDLCI